MESKNDTSTSPSEYKSSAKANVTNKSTIITEPYDLDTTTSDSTYSLTEVPDFNALLAAALGRLGDNQLAWDLISDALNIIN